MRLLSAQTIGGLSLIVGPVLALVFFLFQPGGVLFNNALMDNAAATIVSLERYHALANLTGIGIALGLILALYGQFALLRSLQNDRRDEALSQLGLLFLAVGAFGWVVMQGLNLEMADTYAENAASFQSAAAVFRVEFGISLIAGLAVAFGFLLFSLGLATRQGFNRIAAGIIAVVSVIALVSQIIGISDTSQMNTMIQITRLCYLFWAIWSISLGVGLLKLSQSKPSEEPGNQP